MITHEPPRVAWEASPAAGAPPLTLEQLVALGFDAARAIGVDPDEYRRRVEAGGARVARDGASRSRCRPPFNLRRRHCAASLLEASCPLR